MRYKRQHTENAYASQPRRSFQTGGRVHFDRLANFVQRPPLQLQIAARCQRVLDACHDLQHQPNLAGRVRWLRGNPGLWPLWCRAVQETPFTALGSLQVLAGLEEAFSARGYHILLSSPRLADGNVDPAFTQLMQSGYLEGIILDGHFAVDPFAGRVSKDNGSLV
jgi:DNA-binding LacI/PurR family transcriptional regulator